VPGVDTPCSPLHQVQGGVSPSRGNASKTRASLPQATVEQNRRELLNYVVNERLKKIVKPASILEPGQGGGRQGRCVGNNMQKGHLIQQEARRQGKRVYRVDIDFKNAFNAMSQAALWMLTY